MGKKQKAWAKRKRHFLLELLGAVCVKCKETTNLTFDCIEPRGDEHHKKDTESRMIFYLREWRQGNIQVLCQKCNSRKKADEDQQHPF